MAAERSTIGVIGENLVDLLVQENGAVRARPGGGPFNVARTAARLGAPVVLFSGISSDVFGTNIRSTLANDGVVLAVPQPIDRPTSLAVVELDGASPRYGFHLHETAALGLDRTGVERAFDAVASQLSSIYFGTLGLLIEPMASIGEDLIGAVGDDVVVVIDPNCRPSAVVDRTAYLARLDRLFRRADVVKVSVEDLAYLEPDLTGPLAARHIVAKGARCVIVTDGPDSICVVTAHGDLTVGVPSTDVVDTVGAGDALVGGLMTWWAQHVLTRDDAADIDIMARALEAAVIISVSTCARRGADPPWRAEVAALDP